MRNNYILNTDFYSKYVNEFNNYAMDILYGGQVLIGSDIEDEWKDVPMDDEES